MRVLVAEDHRKLAETVAAGLRREGMAVDIALDGQQALDRAGVTGYDVIVLDRDLPAVHGDRVCAALTAGGCASRILMLTAADTIGDRVDGLGLGADDYLSKPFAFAELVARIRALGRRSGPPGRRRCPAVTCGLTPHGIASRAGRPLALTPKEFAVLQLLLEAQGAVVPAEQLLERGWDEMADPFTTTVKATIHRLRAKLGDPPVIDTVARAPDPGLLMPTLSSRPGWPPGCPAASAAAPDGPVRRPVPRLRHRIAGHHQHPGARLALAPTITFPAPARRLGHVVKGAPQQMQFQVAQQVHAEVVRQDAATLNHLLVVSAIALTVMALASLALGWLIAGRVLRPLRQMTAATRAISEDSLHERLAVPGPGDELKDLGDTIDSLLERLQAAFDAQRNFVASASHELRTPLTLERAMLESPSPTRTPKPQASGPSAKTCSPPASSRNC